MNKLLLRGALLALLPSVFACVSGGEPGDDAGSVDEDAGATVSSALFDGAESAALGAAGNEARCVTCHSADGSGVYPGDTMKDIAYHTSFKGGGAPSLLEASNACITGWMGGSALTEDSAEWASLEAYLQSLSQESATTPNTLAPEVKADLASYEADYAGGDATAGEAAYQVACASCHAAALTVGSVAAPSRSALSGFSVGEIARKVRTSGPPPSSMADAADLTPGPMPFFEPDELDADTLADIIAYIRAGSGA